MPKGLLFSMLSGIFYSLAVANVKQLKKTLHPGQMSAYHFLAIAAFSLPETVKSSESIFGPKDARVLFLTLSVCGAISSFLSFIAFAYLPMGVSIMILSTSPAFVAIAANILLNEPCGLLLYFTTILTIVGIMFTADVPAYLFVDSFSYSNKYSYGVVAALLSLVFAAAHAVITRKLKDVHHAVTVFNSCWMSAIWTIVFTSIFGKFKWHQCSSFHKLYIILFGVASYAEQTLVVLAFRYEHVSPVSTVRAATNIVSSFLFQIFLLHDFPDRYSIIGAALVGLAFLFVGLKKCASQETPT